MASGRYILNYLNAKDEFWYWGVNHIQVNESNLEFNASKQGKNTTFHIEVGNKGFKVKLLKTGTFRTKLVKEYNGIKPSNLSEVITNMVFEKVAA
ncbi:MAG: hypothetical protein ACJA0H_001886 [Francisellaceae bacterium]|jgi:hypothetical protein